MVQINCARGSPSVHDTELARLLQLQLQLQPLLLLHYKANAAPCRAF